MQGPALQADPAVRQAPDRTAVAPRRRPAALGGLRGGWQRLYEYGALYSSLALLALICLGWTVLALGLYPLLPRRRAIRIGRRAIMRGFGWFAAWLRGIGAYRLDLSALDELREQGPMILAPSHPALIDALLLLTRHPNLACVMKSELMANVLLGPGARLARYIRNGSPGQMVRQAVHDLREGGSLLLFPEGTRSVRFPVNSLKRSVAVIARRARVPVQTLLIETDSPFLSKGWPLWKRPSLPIVYRVRLGRRFEPPRDIAMFMAELEGHYRSELQGGPTHGWLGRSTLR